MSKQNSPLLLLGATFWMICTVLSSEILFRAVEMLLAISLVTDYVRLQFSTTSTQKMWLDRIKIFSTIIAGVFLIMEIYYMFFA